jgi:E3 ubiquitin-protein ligase makorin
MTSREICKYFLHGACRNGSGCRFSHQMDAPKSTVCTYYLAGNCAYGDKCRYDHVRPKVRARNGNRGSRRDTPRSPSGSLLRRIGKPRITPHETAAPRTTTSSRKWAQHAAPDLGQK